MRSRSPGVRAMGMLPFVLFLYPGVVFMYRNKNPVQPIEFSSSEPRAARAGKSSGKRSSADTT